jgi:hypothetical protein
MRVFPTLNQLFLIYILIILILPSAQAEEIESLVLGDDAEIDILHIGEIGDTALIWFACNQGEETAEFTTARNLVALGYQTFFPDMLSAHFLSPTASNIGKIPPHEVASVILHIIDESNAKKIYLVGGARAAVPVLKGLAEKEIKSNDRINGALLITPRINRSTPVPGSEPEYIKAVGQTQHSIRVLEGERTPNRWGLPYLKQRLEESGSKVSTALIKGVRGFFYLRNDKTPDEEESTHNLHLIIDTNIQQIGATN